MLLSSLKKSCLFTPSPASGCDSNSSKSKGSFWLSFNLQWHSRTSFSSDTATSWAMKPYRCGGKKTWLQKHLHSIYPLVSHFKKPSQDINQVGQWKPLTNHPPFIKDNPNWISAPNPYLLVSLNGGTPKSSIFFGVFRSKSTSYWGIHDIPISGNPHIWWLPSGYLT